MLGALALIGWLAAREMCLGGRRLLAYARLRRMVDKEVAVPERPEPDDKAGLVEGVLTEWQRHQLLRAVDKDKDLAPHAYKKLVEALEHFRPTDLPPCSLDWGKLDEGAERRHCSQADALWDLGKMRDAA